MSYQNFQSSEGPRTNQCNAIGCNATVDSTIFMCEYHWTKVPYKDKRLLYKHYPLLTREYPKISSKIKLELWTRLEKEGLTEYPAIAYPRK